MPRKRSAGAHISPNDLTRIELAGRLATQHIARTHRINSWAEVRRQLLRSDISQGMGALKEHVALKESLSALGQIAAWKREVIVAGADHWERGVELLPPNKAYS